MALNDVSGGKGDDSGWGKQDGRSDLWNGKRGLKCIALCVALLSKMASSSELLEYSSPVKRRKVDGGGGRGSISAALADPQSSETPRDSPNDDLEGIEIRWIGARDRV